MKKLVSLLALLICKTFANTSIYPLPILFDNSGFIPYATTSLKKENFKELGLYNSNDNTIYYQNKISLYHCNDVKTYYDFLNIKNNNCHKAISIFTPKLEQTLDINKFKIMIYKNNINELASYIFHNDKFIAKLGYNGKNSKEFYDILKSIKINKNIKPLEFYIKKGLESLKFLKLNSAYKYIYSALLIDPKNDKIKPLIKQLEKLQKLKFGMLKNTAGIKENDKSECEDKNNTK